MTQADCTWFGDRAVSVPVTDPAERLGLAESLRRALPDCEVRHGMSGLLVVAPEPDARLLDRAVAACSDADPSDRATARGTSIRIPVQYDGVDLVDVAAVLGASVEGVVGAHADQAWIVAMVGFAPGFGYLVPEKAPILPWDRLARRPSPRTRVPAGSVGVAAGMSAVYPADMPGGWPLIGRTALGMFDAGNRQRPSLLMPGDRVIFEPIR